MIEPVGSALQGVGWFVVAGLAGEQRGCAGGDVGRDRDEQGDPAEQSVGCRVEQVPVVDPRVGGAGCGGRSPGRAGQCRWRASAAGARRGRQWRRSVRRRRRPRAGPVRGEPGRGRPRAGPAAASAAAGRRPRVRRRVAAARTPPRRAGARGASRARAGAPDLPDGQDRGRRVAARRPRPRRTRSRRRAAAGPTRPGPGAAGSRRRSRTRVADVQEAVVGADEPAPGGAHRVRRPGQPLVGRGGLQQRCGAVRPCWNVSISCVRTSAPSITACSRSPLPEATRSRHGPTRAGATPHSRDGRPVSATWSTSSARTPTARTPTASAGPLTWINERLTAG